MTTNLGASSRASPRATYFQKPQTPPAPLVLPLERWMSTNKTGLRIKRSSRIRVSNDESSYLDMWKNAVDRERKAVEFQILAEKLPGLDNGSDENNIVSGETVDLEKKSEDFKKLLDVSKEERDRIQRMQVIDRAAAAIAAARAILKEERPATAETNDVNLTVESGGEATEFDQRGTERGSIFVSRSGTSENGVPGPDFWSWTPPPNSDGSSDYISDFMKAQKSSVYPTLTKPVAFKEQSVDFLSIPFESKLSETNHNLSIPPLQSSMEVGKEEVLESSLETPSREEEDPELGVLFSVQAAEAARALDKDKIDLSPSYGVNPDGSRWWKETGIEQRPDGVICRWTMARGVSVDQDVEWQEKFWEAADEFGYKELGSEKSGRDATGNVWREYWRESMRQESGLVHLEKTADKWGKNGKGDEWQEKWWEHYDASGQAEKWAHKWCSIDPTTKLEAGHAHVWHERWGEKYDGRGGSMKYTDKWAERCEDDGWAKWGDKWDENFDLNGGGVKQGETWWEGKNGQRWNRTWGERHNGSGWVHKYGKSSSGEHWDTHVQQKTWYERFPHYGFYHCLDNSVQLQAVQKPSTGEGQES